MAIRRRITGKSDYVQAYVAFVDILGFGELVKSADKSESLRSNIVQALRAVRQLPKGIQSTALKAQNFSDSLILSTSVTPEGLWRLILSLDKLSIDLLKIGVLARGAVARGGVYQDDEIVFGVGVNEAYRLESKVARYPRIILSKSVVSDATNFASQYDIWKTYRQTRLKRDFDGVTFINYLNDISAANRHPRDHLKPETDEWASLGKDIRTVIQGKLDETLDAPDIYDKVRWLGNYWNSSVVTNAIDPSHMAFGPVILAGQEERISPLPFRNSR